MSAIEKLLAEGWQELELGTPRWRWFIRNEENAYYYTLTSELFFASSLRDVLQQLPYWQMFRGGYLIDTFFVDPSTIKLPKVTRAKLREGSGNFQNDLFKKIR